MSRIERLFKDLKNKNEKALITYITAGDPDMETTGRLIEVLVENGADMIELGVPFSDPMADGPTIQRASQRALSNPFSVNAFGKYGENFILFKKSIPPLTLLFNYNL